MTRVANTSITDGEPNFFIGPDVYERVTINGIFRVDNAGVEGKEPDDDWVGFVIGYNTEAGTFASREVTPFYDMLVFQ